ncbi:MAG: hypothetical protein EAX95_15760 [Candidatus Thorarchaeota archaeon]|nr:hypothetical protein [Candidatus Thorarchaeota archaeon]
MSKRVYFDEPIVRANVNRIRFPHVCAVCGRPATTANRVITSPRKNGFYRQYGRMPSTWKRLGVSSPEIKSFRIPVCEDHDVSDGAIPRFRTASSFFLTLSLSLMVFAVIFIGGSLWLGRGIPHWSGLLFLFFGSTFFMAYAAFRPQALEVAIKVVGFDANLSNVWLQFSNQEYKRIFMEENLANAELVKWITKI